MKNEDVSSDGASSVLKESEVTTTAAAPMKLAPSLKARWIAELRSGKREQGTGDLYANGRYCCLGVLHEIVTGETPPTEWGSLRVGRPYEINPLDSVITKLTHMNDTGKSFPEIADWIEANL